MAQYCLVQRECRLECWCLCNMEWRNMINKVDLVHSRHGHAADNICIVVDLRGGRKVDDQARNMHQADLRNNSENICGIKAGHARTEWYCFAPLCNETETLWGNVGSRNSVG